MRWLHLASKCAFSSDNPIEIELFICQYVMIVCGILLVSFIPMKYTFAFANCDVAKSKVLLIASKGATIIQWYTSTVAAPMNNECVT